MRNASRSSTSGPRDHAPPHGSGQRSPRYVDLGAVLRSRIAEGEWRSRLPSVEKLAHEFGMSRSTVREALRLLEQQGLIRVRHGSGTEVLRTARLAGGLEELWSTSELIRRAGKVPGTRQLEVSRFLASPSTVPLLRGHKVVLVERVRTADEVPLLFSVDVVRDLGWPQDFLEAALNDGSLLSLWEEAGERIAYAEAVVTAGVANTHFASVLQVPEGSPLLLMSETLYDSRGGVVGTSEDAYRVDVIDFRILRRRLPRPEGWAL